MREYANQSEYSQEILNKQKLVEFYDYRQDPVKIYFKEKIQILLSSMKTRELLKNIQKNPTKTDKYQE